MNANTKQIGIYHLTEDTDFCPSHEYAGHHTTIRVPAGDYPVLDTPSRGSLRYTVSMAGTMTESQFMNRCGGAHSLRVEQPMSPAVHTLHPYGFNLADMVLAGVVTLDDPREHNRFRASAIGRQARLDAERRDNARQLSGEGVAR